MSPHCQLRCALPLLLLAVLLPLLPAQTPAGKRYAVLVGIKDYNHSKLGLLDFAENDVGELGQLLSRHGYQVTLLTGTEGRRDSRLQPTLRNIEARLAEVLEKCKRHDTVLVALAGHGLQFEGKKDAFFCPEDARPLPERTETLLSLSKVYRHLDESGAGVKLLLVDACRDDPTVPRGSRRGVDGVSGPRPPKGVAALFSCSAGESAFESPRLKHGVFFHYVLEGLRGKAAVEGTVTWDGLQGYVRTRVSRDVNGIIGGDVRQTPALSAGELAGEPPVLLTVQDVERVTAEKPALLRAPFSQAKAREAQQAWAKYLGRKVEEEVDLGGGVAMQVVLIPPGTFTMGSPKDEEGRYDNEEAHPVTISRPFYLGKYEVTQEQYQQLIGENPSWFSRGGGGKEKVAGQDTSRFPVETVSWDGATALCEKLGRRGGLKAHLPSEAQWEWACRAGTDSPFHFGIKLDRSQANFNDAANFLEGVKNGHTCRVGSYAANGLGLYDMHGNVWEWCQDWYGPYQGLDSREPLRVDKGSDNARVLRGGSWSDPPRYCRAAIRSRIAPANRYDSLGFRVAFRLD